MITPPSVSITRNVVLYVKGLKGISEPASTAYIIRIVTVFARHPITSTTGLTPFVFRINSIMLPARDINVINNVRPIMKLVLTIWLTRIYFQAMAPSAIPLANPPANPEIASGGNPNAVVIAFASRVCRITTKFA